MKILAKTFTLECTTPFLFEKHSETYNRYVEASIAEENGVVCQELCCKASFAWFAGAAA